MTGRGPRTVTTFSSGMVVYTVIVRAGNHSVLIQMWVQCRHDVGPLYATMRGVRLTLKVHLDPLQPVS